MIQAILRAVVRPCAAAAPSGCTASALVARVEAAAASDLGLIVRPLPASALRTAVEASTPLLIPGSSWAVVALRITIWLEARVQQFDPAAQLLLPAMRACASVWEAAGVQPAFMSGCG